MRFSHYQSALAGVRVLSSSGVGRPANGPGAVPCLMAPRPAGAIPLVACVAPCCFLPSRADPLDRWRGCPSWIGGHFVYQPRPTPDADRPTDIARKQ